MTHADRHDRLSAGRAHSAGWFVSIGLHGGLALGALLLLRQMHLAPQTEPFEWDVAMVQPVDAQSPSAADNESAPNPPAPTHSPVPVQKHLTPAPIQPLPPPVVPRQSPPTQRQHTPPQSELASPSPVQAAAPSEPEPRTEPIREEPHPQPHPAVKTNETPLQRSTSESPAVPSPHSMASPEPPGDAAPPSNAISQVATPNKPSLAPAVSSNAAKPDDGWLSDLMGKWIADLEKHYPATLRMEGVQGKVVLVATLHEDGTLRHVTVSKSSGNALLDQAAIADVEQGPPIKLSRPLGQPQRPIKFSISYDLKTAR